MANEEHVAILMQGVDVWNEWRQENWPLQPDLSAATLSGINLIGANFSRADLFGTNMSVSYLSRANFLGANVAVANLSRSDLGGADLRGVNLSRTDLSRATLTGVSLMGATLSGTNLYKTNLHGASTQMTLFADVDLRDVQGLDTVRHDGPSSIGIDTLYASGGNIPEIFLRGCGVPDSMIEYARALVVAERPIDYYSCFISYSSKDEALAERLYADLQAKGVRCWFAPHDLEIGEPILSGIDRGIRLHDKLLLILSAASVESVWIEQEVQMALARERNERRRVLFPIRIDDTVSAQTAGWPALVWNERHVGNFCTWKEHDAYQAAFARLLRDLRAG